MSAIQVFLLYINHSEFSWYIKQCPLLGRGPLLGASINGELTVLSMCTIIMSELRSCDRLIYTKTRTVNFRSATFHR